MDLEFGNYCLKRAERLLLGPKGPVELSARSFDILAMLLERPDEVTSKTELFDAVWARPSGGGEHSDRRAGPELAVVGSARLGRPNALFLEAIRILEGQAAPACETRA
jgi:hypothetical protein